MTTKKLSDDDYTHAMAELNTAATPDEAFAAGQAKARDGANVQNCALRFFARPELTAAWERGANKPAQAMTAGSTVAPYDTKAAKE